MPAKKPFPLRIAPALYERLAQWAADEFRSVNAHIELLLRNAVKQAERSPESALNLDRSHAAGLAQLSARPVKEKKAFPLRIDEKLYEAIAAWAERDRRSVNAQIERLLYAAAVGARRMSPPPDPPDEAP